MKVIAKLLPERDTSNVDMTLSVSKTKTFEDCAAKFKFCYIEKLPRIDRDFHIFGKFLHQVLENFHQDILDADEKGDSGPRDNWKETLKKAWASAVDEYDGQMTGKQYKEAQKIVKEYEEILEEEGLPNVTHAEKAFYINLNDKVLLNGFIDRIQIDPDGVIHVADYKTTKNPKYLKDFFQLITYCYALMIEDESLQRVRASFILLRHGFDYITEEYTRDQVIPIAEKFLKQAYKIEEEKVWRPNPQFLCKYCDYLEFCRKGKSYLISKGIIDEKPQTGIRSW